MELVSKMNSTLLWNKASSLNMLIEIRFESYFDSSSAYILMCFDDEHMLSLSDGYSDTRSVGLVSSCIQCTNVVRIIHTNTSLGNAKDVNHDYQYTIISIETAQIPFLAQPNKSIHKCRHVFKLYRNSANGHLI